MIQMTNDKCLEKLIPGDYAALDLFRDEDPATYAEIKAVLKQMNAIVERVRYQFPDARFGFNGYGTLGFYLGDDSRLLVSSTIGLPFMDVRKIEYHQE